MATAKKAQEPKRKPLSERNFTTKRVREEDEAEGIRVTSVPGKKAETKKK